MLGSMTKPGSITKHCSLPYGGAWVVILKRSAESLRIPYPLSQTA